MPDTDPRSRPIQPTTAEPLWHRAPVALALIEGDQIVAWNPACRALLSSVVGGTELAWQRWLAAAVVRLYASGRSEEILSASADHAICLAVKLGPAGSDPASRLVALREVNAAGRQTEDLLETVGTLSHEFHTPLAAIRSSLRLMLAGEAGALLPDQERFLGLAARNIARLERLVDDLLDMSRAEAGELALQRQQTDLGPLLRDALAVLALDAETAGLAFDSEGVPARFVANVDGDKVTQMMINVVGNALKYVPRGGLVRVWLERRPQPDPGLAWELAQSCFLPLQTFNLVVEDNGPGIAAEDLARIFEPFQRGRRDGGESIAGAGLGLTITRRLVEAHGGRIRLASQPGQGTTVWIRLPRNGDTERLLKAAAQLEGLSEQHGNRTAGARIAVLDARSWPEAAAAALHTAHRFLLKDHGVAAGPGIELAENVVATVARAPVGWTAAWQEYLAQMPDGGGIPAGLIWRFLEAPTASATAVAVPSGAPSFRS